MTEKRNHAIPWKGYEIRHWHARHLVFFQAWKGYNAIDGIQSPTIRKVNQCIDWENPLTDEDKDYLVMAPVPVKKGGEKNDTGTEEESIRTACL